MIRAEYGAQKVTELATLPRFPYDQDARLAILRTLSEMVQYAGRKPGDTWDDTNRKDEEALDWLIRRAINLWNKWEGLRELRAIYCARFYPGDGIESTSAIYVDGVPPDPQQQLALPAPALTNTWPPEELEAIGKAWAGRNKLSPAEKRRQEMRAWMGAHEDVIVLDSAWDDALIGVAKLVSDRKIAYAVYDWEALAECLMDRENLSADEAAQAIANLTSEVLLFYRPPGASLRTTICTTPVTQNEIDQALTVARAKREGWTPERLADVEMEARRREKQANERD